MQRLNKVSTNHCSIQLGVLLFSGYYADNSQIVADIWSFEYIKKESVKMVKRSNLCLAEATLFLFTSSLKNHNSSINNKCPIKIKLPSINGNRKKKEIFFSQSAQVQVK